MKAHFREYEAKAESVPGWMPPKFTRVVAVIDNVQWSGRVLGSVAEIGVHCGRSFAPLVLMKRPAETAYALDCFDNWEANPERSGGTTEERFLSEMRAVRVPMDGVRVVRCDARATPHPFAGLAPLRVASIDADHSADATWRDLCEAEAVLVSGGVIIADDVFNQDWPAVSEGLHRYLCGTRRFVAALAGFGKIVLAEEATAHALQERAVGIDFGLAGVRQQKFHGFPLLVVTAGPIRKPRH